MIEYMFLKPWSKIINHRKQTFLMGSPTDTMYFMTDLRLERCEDALSSSAMLCNELDLGQPFLHSKGKEINFAMIYPIKGTLICPRSLKQTL